MKLNFNTCKYRLVEYSRTNQWRMWDEEKEDIIVSKDVIFDKDPILQNMEIEEAEEVEETYNSEEKAQEQKV